MTTWAAVALITGILGVFAASASAAQIEVVANTHSNTTVALPPAGRAGNAEASQWVIRDRHGRAIGDMLLDCRWITSGLRLCVGQMSLPLGVIAVLGASRTRFVGQMSVVGGTGRYVGAVGTLLFKQIGVTRYVLSVDYERQL